MSDQETFLQTLTDSEAEGLLYNWSGFLARPNQLPPPGAWIVWLILAGRGFGKSRSGSEWVRSQIESGKCGRMAIVARTAADVRDVCIEGESGVLAVCPRWNRPKWEPSKRRLTWPNGAITTTYSADEPDLLRGPQHDSAWCDELASWKYPETWDMLQFGLRLGDDPRACVTTTPKPTKVLRELMAGSATVITRGSTYENKANLAKPFLDTIIAKYENTRLGRQELLAEVLEDVEGALWTHALLEVCRVRTNPALKRIVIAVDPATSEHGGGDACGIVAAGRGEDDHGYLLEDGTLNASPDGWARRAVSLCHRWKADRIVAEVNQGGALVSRVIRTVDPNVPITLVHASRGKYVRAEPIAALYEQFRVHHVGMFAELEDELCDWTPVSGARSPNRLDASVWAFTDLMLGPKPFQREILRPK